jgi:hypothetical protein
MQRASVGCLLQIVLDEWHFTDTFRRRKEYGIRRYYDSCSMCKCCVACLSEAQACSLGFETLRASNMPAPTAWVCDPAEYVNDETI